MAVRTSSSSPGRAAGWTAVLAGLASVATLPVAVYATRLSDRYDLLHSAFAIPVAGVFGLLAVRLARRVRRRDAIRLGRSDSRAGRVGRLLGVVGLCMAASALVALAVYGLLEYVGTQD